jgi:hypothetical protein
MDVAGIVYGRKDGNLLGASGLVSNTLPDGWTRTTTTNVYVDTAYGGTALDARSFILVCDGADASATLTNVEQGTYSVAVDGGSTVGISCVLERASSTWPNGAPDAKIVVTLQQHNSADALLDTDTWEYPEVFLQYIGDVWTLIDTVTLAATTAYLTIEIGWAAAAGGDTGAVAVRNVHIDTAAPGGAPVVGYYPAAPTSVDQRVRIFDYSDQRLTATGAGGVLEHATAWYGVAASERDREPVGTVVIQGDLKTIDGAPGFPGYIQTGDWITVVDDIEHTTWPAWIAGVECTDDGETATIQLGGDGGDFNYMGRAETPAMQKRKRRRGHHHRVLWHRWALKNARKNWRKHKGGYKTFAAYMKANPLPKKHPKWGPG